MRESRSARGARDPRVPRALATCLAALSFLAAPVEAEDDPRIVMHRAQVRVHGSYRWPELCHRGWVPVTIALENFGTQARELELSGSLPYGSQDLELEQTVVLAPGETRELEWLVPLLPSLRRDLSVRVESGFETYWLGPLGPSQGLDPSSRALLVASPRETTTPAPHWLEHWKSGQGPAGEGDGGNRCDWERVTYAELPLSLRALSSLDAVVLDAEDALPDERELELLARYVAAGGTLAVLGAVGAEQLAQRAPFAGAFEPRFERARAQRVALYGMGLGLVLFGAPALDDLRPEEGELLGRSVAAQRSCVPALREEGQPGDLRGATAIPRIPALGHLPVRAFLFVLLGFALVIGPLNFWLVQRLKRPVLLLVTVPALSLCFCAGLLAITFAREGISTQIASRSLTMLDQRAQRRATVEWRTFYAPLSPGTALVTRAGTTLHLPPDESHSSRRPRYVIDADTGALGGAFLPSRREARQVAIEESACAERLAFERRGGALRVTNLLGVAVRALEVYDGDGARHVLAEPLASGASAELAPASARGDAAALLSRIENLGYAGTTPLRIPSELRDLYAAEIDAPPWLDRGPLQGREVHGEHLLCGTLSLGELASR